MFAAFGVSDRGCLRPNNEDYCIVEPGEKIFIVADGMGGANAGEYASKLSAQSLYTFLRRPGQPDGVETLEEAFRAANRAVRDAARRDPGLDGMGTTLVAARGVGSSQVQIGSVGDSRAYISVRGEFALVTQDQTWVAEVGPQLGLTEEALKKHPMRHVLTMAVGTAEELRVGCKTVDLNAGDQILLCSDGLHGVVAEEILRSTLHSEKTLAEKCHYLVDAAKAQGAPDNVTVVLIQVV